MIAAQPPPLAVLIWAQTVPGADMSSQRLSAVAAIETDHIISAHGAPYRDSGSENLLWFRRLSKLSKRSMNRCNEF